MFLIGFKSFKNSFGTIKLLEKYGFDYGMKRREYFWQLNNVLMKIILRTKYA
jgi:hypothetical protein